MFHTAPVVAAEVLHRRATWQLRAPTGADVPPVLLASGPSVVFAFDAELTQHRHIATQRRHGWMVHAVGMSRVIQMPVIRGRSAIGPCAVCSAAAVRPYFMTHGVVVALCKAHREVSYLRRRSGRVFGEDLRRHFSARHGSLSTRQRAAIQIHVDRVLGVDLTSGPGSYAWPTVRLEAEQRFAAGDDPRVVITQLRRRYSGSIAIVPSVRTLQRWFMQGRWLVEPALWSRVRHDGSRRRNHRPIEYLAGSRLEEAIFHPTLAWARKLNPGFSIDRSFTMRA